MAKYQAISDVVAFNLNGTDERRLRQQIGYRLAQNEMEKESERNERTTEEDEPQQ